MKGERHWVKRRARMYNKKGRIKSDASVGYATQCDGSSSSLPSNARSFHLILLFRLRASSGLTRLPATTPATSSEAKTKPSNSLRQTRPLPNLHPHRNLPVALYLTLYILSPKQQTLISPNNGNQQQKKIHAKRCKKPRPLRPANAAQQQHPSKIRRRLRKLYCCVCRTGTRHTPQRDSTRVFDRPKVRRALSAHHLTLGRHACASDVIPSITRRSRRRRGHTHHRCAAMGRT